ncbi:MAG: FtsW/RodA/SpoVE family cell cycle protein [Allosphingosinicella sp.]|uniref:FtsW/RodA/SpoVE family cell cycle protein n=1 Tax=Allosphingosinicella sp. TaxID=2823234 RepID=UPI0039573E61
MSRGLRRGAADLVCRLLLASLPTHLRPWGDAVRQEVTHIPDQTEALLYALGSLAGLLPRALATHLSHPMVGHEPRQTLSRESTHMSESRESVFRPRRFAVACGAGAVLSGLAYLGLADAPSSHLAVNALALLIGFVLMAMLDRLSARSGAWRPAVIVAAAAAILFTAVLGQPVEGASRWARVAGLSIQPSLILVPLLVLAFARAKDWLSTAGVLVVALALALQPDRGMAGALAAGMIAIALLRPDRTAVMAALGAAAGFAATLFRPDRLPAVPHVDQILYTAFGTGTGAGMAMLGGAFLLILPAIMGLARDRDGRILYAAHGAVWSAIVLAAALGNYPTPVVGYGGSAILGYFLALAALPKTAAGRREGRSSISDVEAKPPGRPTLRAAPSSA